MGVLTAGYEEEQMRVMNWLGVALLAAFFFPVYVWLPPHMSSLRFFNIELLGRGDFITILGLLYPLAAAIIIFWVVYYIETISRPLILLAVGFFPILISFFYIKDFISGSMREYSGDIWLMLLLILALIGVFVGSKLVSVSEHISGRLIGGISGLIFMMIVLLPVSKSGKPLYFELFSFLRPGTRAKLPGSALFMSISIIAIFTCYLLASLIAVLNFSHRPSSDRTAVNSYKLVFYATLAFPVSLLLVLVFASGPGGGKWMLFTILVKITLLVAGIVGTIALGLWDLIDRLLPRTVRGGDLLSSGGPGGAVPPGNMA